MEKGRSDYFPEKSANEKLIESEEEALLENLRARQLVNA